MIDENVRVMGFEEYLERVRRFTDEELIPSEWEMAERGAVPEDLVTRMGDLGLFGMTLPREHGGLGWSMEQQVLLTFEFTRASVVYRSRFSTTIGLTSQILLDHGTSGQQLYLPVMAGGDCVTAFALTEDVAGSDAGALRTSAVRDGDGYVINGTKRYITNGAWADLVVVFARTGTEADGALSAFLVPADAPGFSVRLPERMNGHEAGPVAELEFRDVHVGPDALIGAVEGRGLEFAMRGINHARTHVAATAVGQATRLLDEAARHARERVQFGRPIGDLGAVQAWLGRSYAEIAAGRALVLDCARAFDAGEIPRHQIAAAKYFCTEMASSVADRAVQILGGAGIVGDSPVPRMWRDVRALRIYEGASEVHERNLARHVLRACTAGAGVPA
ncbi:Acryloyl-CoA reductase [Tsukamurella ocularis]